MAGRFGRFGDGSFGPRESRVPDRTLVEMDERTNAAQHHHAWIVFDHAHPKDQPPAMLFA